jgi:hypothetical protein
VPASSFISIQPEILYTKSDEREDVRKVTGEYGLKLNDTPDDSNAGKRIAQLSILKVKAVEQP